MTIYSLFSSRSFRTSRLTLSVALGALLVVTVQSQLAAAPDQAASSTAAEPTAADLMRRMLAAVAQVQTTTYRLIKTERIAGKNIVEETAVKLQNKPLKVYIKSVKPNTGREVLYVTGSNGGKALINPGSFPYVNISLEPLGARIRQGQHHTLNDVGFRRVADVIARQMREQQADLPKLLHLEPQAVTFDNRPCWVVKMDDPRFRFVPYTIKAGGESLDQLGQKLGVSDFMIGEKMSGFDGDFQRVLPAGEVIQVPTTYARRTTVIIDKASLLPVSIAIYDDKGLFEQYDYHDLKPSTVFRDNEFTPDFKGYGF
jgi:outer membrane lipoprotein-sorting protein